MKILEKMPLLEWLNRIELKYDVSDFILGTGFIHQFI